MIGGDISFVRGGGGGTFYLSSIIFFFVRKNLFCFTSASVRPLVTLIHEAIVKRTGADVRAIDIIAILQLPSRLCNDSRTLELLSSAAAGCSNSASIGF